MEEKNQSQNEIDLVELFYYLLKKVWIIVLAAAVCCVAAFTVTKLFMTPQYTASTRMYVLTKNDQKGGVGVSDFQVSTWLLKDYQVLITGRNVTAEAVKRLDLDRKPAQLASQIRVTAPEDTRILQVDVTDPDPKTAANLANCIREIAAEQITDIMDADAVKTVYEAEIPERPSSPNAAKNSVLGGIIGLLISAGVYVVIFLVDDTMRNEDDIAHYLGLTTLGVIPVSEQLNTKHPVKKGSGRHTKITVAQRGQ